MQSYNYQIKSSILQVPRRICDMIGARASPCEACPIIVQLGHGILRILHVQNTYETIITYVRDVVFEPRETEGCLPQCNPYKKAVISMFVIAAVDVA